MSAKMLLAATALALTSPANAAGASDITGRWLTQDKDAIMEISPCGSAMCGRLVKILKGDPNARDVNNPDTSKRGRPILGSTILHNFVSEGGKWHGRIYDPRRGRLFNSYLSPAGKTLNVKGCLGPFCKTQRWSRIS